MAVSIPSRVVAIFLHRRRLIRAEMRIAIAWIEVYERGTGRNWIVGDCKGVTSM